MQNGWNTMHFNDQGLRQCSELVKRADCYQLIMGGLKEAGKLIEKLTGESRVSVEYEVLNNIWRRLVRPLSCPSRAGGDLCRSYSF